MVQQHIRSPLLGLCIYVVLQHILDSATKLVYIRGTTTHVQSRYKGRVFTWCNHPYSIPAARAVFLHGTTKHIQPRYEDRVFTWYNNTIPAAGIVYLQFTTTHI